MSCGLQVKAVTKRTNYEELKLILAHKTLADNKCFITNYQIVKKGKGRKFSKITRILVEREITSKTADKFLAVDSF